MSDIKKRTVLKVSKDHKGIYIDRLEASFKEMFGLIPVLVESMAQVSDIDYNEILSDMMIPTKEEETKEEK